MEKIEELISISQENNSHAHGTAGNILRQHPPNQKMDRYLIDSKIIR